MSKGLSPRTAAVLAALRAKAEYAEGDGWLAVYLDNAKPDDMSAHAFAGHLSALEKADFYKPTDGTAWGSVKSNGLVTVESFPVTLVGDPGHAAAQKATIDRLLRRKK